MGLLKTGIGESNRPAGGMKVQVPVIQLDSELKRGEASYWDRKALARTAGERIPLEADIRRARRATSILLGQGAIDPRVNEILDGKYRTRFINWVSSRQGGRVLDIGCGPGWLSLELGRRGMIVDAYDLSSEAIAVANRMLEENPYREGFGQVNYHVQDVTDIDLGRERYDAVCGWSAFHHLPSLSQFMERVRVALKPGGIVATLDDLIQGPLEKWLQRVFSILLPSYHRSYRQKLMLLLRRLSKLDQNDSYEGVSPMEALSTQEISPILYGKFAVLEDVRFNAFATLPLLMLKGPDVYRYLQSHALVELDRLLCRAGICEGFYRMIIARKRVHGRIP